jgi:hypothetical protein
LRPISASQTFAVQPLNPLKPSETVPEESRERAASLPVASVTACCVPATFGVKRLCVGDVVGDDVGTAPPGSNRGSGEAESGSGSTTAQAALVLKVASLPPSLQALTAFCVL